MKQNDKGKFYIGFLLVVASAAWTFFLGFHLIHTFVLVAGLVLMLIANYKFSK